MGKASYYSAPSVKVIAEELIEKYHTRITDFNVRVEYAFTDKTPKSKGREVWSSCKLISGLNAYLSNGSAESSYFVIIISEPVWDTLDHDDRVALVDHELCHVGVEPAQNEETDGSEDVVKLSVLAHDCEAFNAEINRHGNWRDGK